MKWLKSRKLFLNEAKIRDVIHKRQAEKVSEKWGEKYLDYEEVDPTDKIEQGKWKLSNEDKMAVFSTFFKTNMKSLFDNLNNIPDEFHEALKLSIDNKLLDSDFDDYRNVISRFDIKDDPSMEELYVMFLPMFRKISVGETKAKEIIKRGEDGRPIFDEEGKVIKIDKKEGEIIFTNNLVNINTFLTDFNSCFPDKKVSEEFIKLSTPVKNILSESHLNDGFKVDFEIFNKDLYLQIEHKVKDILNISISKFFSSCQNLYTGSYSELVLSNVFDINSIPAFLKFDVPIYDSDDNIVSEQVPICRMMIRDIENRKGKHKGIFFDRCYPVRMQDIFNEIVEKYTKNKNTTKDVDRYYWKPDIGIDDDSLATPYMDILDEDRLKVIGKNARNITLTQDVDWSKYIILPNIKIDIITIDSVKIPKKLNFETNTLRIRFIDIKSMKPFKDIKYNKVILDKCKLNQDIIDDILKSEIKDLDIISCNIDKLDLSKINKLDNLGIMYTIDPRKPIKDIIDNINIKNLKISSDIMMNKDNRDYINSLKSKGLKVEIIGPKI
jgi:hypothetical protein